MQQPLGFFEGPLKALEAAVQAVGGYKRVGQKVWPDLAADAAGRKLANCLNDSHAEKLDIGKVMYIFRLAKDLGYHQPMEWMCAEMGYECKPLVRQEQVDRLLDVVQEASRTFSSAVAALERLQGVRK